MAFTLLETVVGRLPLRASGSSVVVGFDKFIPVTLAEGPHPFPFRTRPLSPPAPMVLSGRPGGRVGRCRDFFLHIRSRAPVHLDRGFFVEATGRGPVLDFGQDRAGEGPCRDIPSGTRSSTRRARSTR